MTSPALNVSEFLQDVKSNATPSQQLWAVQWWPTWCVVAALAVAGRMPSRARLFVGQALGRVLMLTMRRRRAIAAANLSLCFGDQSRLWQEQLLCDHFKELGIAVLDTAAAWVQPPTVLAGLIKLRGREHLDHALDKGRGVILVAAHMTTLEMSMQLASMRGRVSAIYRRNKNPVIEYLTVAGRTRSGTRLIERQDMRSVVATLRRNEVLWISPDQDHGVAHGAFVEFFGNPAATVTTPARLAKRTGAQVLVLLYRRLPDCAGYELELTPTLKEFPGDDLSLATRRLNRIFEQQAYVVPAQYLWVHRRFKTRPEGLQAVYR